MRIVPANNPEQVRQARGLFEEYAASLSYDLCFQNFQQELDGLPGAYAPPEGGLWLAVGEQEEAAGCVGLRSLEPGVGELKRLYIRPPYRGTGLGKRLVRTALRAAVDLGYERLRLDTLPDMKDAIRLYESLGFTRIAPYRFNPVEGTVYMEIRLNGDPVELVQVRPEQVELVAPLFDAYRQFYGQPADLDGARWFLAERLKRGESVVFAAVESGRTLGLAQLYPSFSSLSMKPVWILNDLFVSEEARRRGIGGRLLRAAREHAVRTGAIRLALSTMVTNTTAQALYERDGWKRDTVFFHYEYELPPEEKGCSNPTTPH